MNRIHSSDQTENQSAARDIYQAHLDNMTKSLFDNRFDGFRQGILLPHHIRHLNCDFCATTETDLREMFDTMRTRFLDDGITDLIRLVQDARFVTAEEIMGEHVSEMLRGAKRAIEPYANAIRLVKGADGLWRETHCANAIMTKAGQFGLYDPTRSGGKVPDMDQVSRLTS